MEEPPGPGLHDRLIDELLGERLDALVGGTLAADIREVDAAELPDRVGELLGRRIREALGALADLDAAAAAFWRHEGHRRELLELPPLLEERTDHLHLPLELPRPAPSADERMPGARGPSA